MKELVTVDKREGGRWANSRIENSNLYSRRGRAILPIWQIKTPQTGSSVHAAIRNNPNQDGHFISRET